MLDLESLQLPISRLDDTRLMIHVRFLARPPDSIQPLGQDGM